MRGILIGSVVGVVVGLGPWAARARADVTVTPAGDHFTGSLVPGTTAQLGGAICTRSMFTSAVPAVPANHSTSVVSTPITAPIFDDGPGVPCSPTVTVTTSGTWNVGWSTSFATITIPQNGVRYTQTIFGVSCTTTFAPSGPVVLSGTWTSGTSTTPPRMTFNTTAPTTVTGSILCPRGTGTFAASYQIVDTTTPGNVITVGP